MTEPLNTDGIAEVASVAVTEAEREIDDLSAQGLITIDEDRVQLDDVTIREEEITELAAEYSRSDLQEMCDDLEDATEAADDEDWELLQYRLGLIEAALDRVE